MLPYKIGPIVRIEIGCAYNFPVGVGDLFRIKEGALDQCSRIHKPRSDLASPIVLPNQVGLFIAIEIRHESWCHSDIEISRGFLGPGHDEHHGARQTPSRHRSTL